MNKRSWGPGKGWVHLHGPVWEHTTGARIHMLGMIRLPDGSTRSGSDMGLDGALAYLYTRINGGNRRRGLMAWARAEAERMLGNAVPR